ncbi:MAG: DUF523 and DUF1722 domain-containing protein [candidate division Zixibacteria bacterium]|nr:DUF523 and DUF1722 domain-containing protein [candidate division Zixibacteria bacterium]MDH3936747.1 DUF523 and DUF1722 domain-containing protein [candidate division Zixibacteria bacterium]MDH4033776.1 DUF523 and DUF1722 domain-containing protein [candidate division Zixibacteria bacterium]
MNQSVTSFEPAIGVSSCLLGKPVRFDGGHKLDRYITEVLGKVFAFVPVCPEVETGMGVPRETIDLHGTRTSPRLIGNDSGRDRTQEMKRWSSQRLRRPDFEHLCGFILKSKSPTCGLKKVRLLDQMGRSSLRGQGLFATALLRQYPLLPVVEERELSDESVRENFVVRLFACHRMQVALDHRPTVRKLTSFHHREICLLDAHHKDGRRRLDRLLARASSSKPTELRQEYAIEFMRILKLKSTQAKRISVLKGICRTLMKHDPVSGMSKSIGLIDDYRRGRCDLHRPWSMLRGCAETYGVRELLAQSWLFPDEREVNLRCRT